MDVTYKIVVTDTITNCHKFTLNEAHANNAINKHGSIENYVIARFNPPPVQVREGLFNDWEVTRNTRWLVHKPKFYEVTVRGTSTKTISVEAETEDQATDKAHELFTMSWDEEEDSYEQETLHIEVDQFKEQ